MPRCGKECCPCLFCAKEGLSRLPACKQRRQVRFLRGNRRKISEQLQHRHEHFMNPVLLDSQFEDLEEPQPSEDALSLELGRRPGDLVELIKTKLKLRR